MAHARTHELMTHSRAQQLPQYHQLVTAAAGAAGACGQPRLRFYIEALLARLLERPPVVDSERLRACAHVCVYVCACEGEFASATSVCVCVLD